MPSSKRPECASDCPNDAPWTLAVRIAVIRRIIKDVFIQIGISSLKTKGPSLMIFPASYFLVIDERYPNVVKVLSLSFPGKCKWLVLLQERPTPQTCL